MNYRRGFQRVYAVLTVVWIAASLIALPAHRLRFWEAPSLEGEKIQFEPLPGGMTIDELARKHGSTVEPAGGTTPDSFVQDEPTFTRTCIGKSLWLAGLLFLPPLAGYATIFLVIPWIYRGFRLGTQI